jgi:hypothetical protein
MSIPRQSNALAETPGMEKAGNGEQAEKKRGRGRQKGETTAFWELVDELLDKGSSQDTELLWKELEKHKPLIATWSKTEIQWRKANGGLATVTKTNFGKLLQLDFGLFQYGRGLFS